MILKNLYTYKAWRVILLQVEGLLQVGQDREASKGRSPNNYLSLCLLLLHKAGGGGGFQGQRMGSWLTLRNELSEETHVLSKHETLWGRGAWAGNSRIRELRRTALPQGPQSQVLWEWGQFPGCLWPIVLLRPYLVWLRVLPDGVHISQPRWLPVPRTLGGWSWGISIGEWETEWIRKGNWRWRHDVESKHRHGESRNE